MNFGSGDASCLFFAESDELQTCITSNYEKRTMQHTDGVSHCSYIYTAQDGFYTHQLAQFDVSSFNFPKAFSIINDTF